MGFKRAMNFLLSFLRMPLTYSGYLGKLSYFRVMNKRKDRRIWKLGKEVSLSEGKGKN